jgi:hypothetical protein
MRTGGDASTRGAIQERITQERIQEPRGSSGDQQMVIDQGDHRCEDALAQLVPPTSQN